MSINNKMALTIKIEASNNTLFFSNTIMTSQTLADIKKFIITLTKNYDHSQ